MNAHPCMKRSILIVDDEFGLPEMLRDVLDELGYEPLVARNGRLGLEMVRTGRIDLVLTDLMMPIMDGIELARAMRSDPAFRHIPIVLMTSLPEAVPTDAGLYNAVLRKPFAQDLLLTIIELQLDDGLKGSRTH